MSRPRLVIVNAEPVTTRRPTRSCGKRFRHDRIREVIPGGLGPGRRRALQLAMARRLAAVPQLFTAAAEQYLEVAGEVHAAAERRAAADPVCVPVPDAEERPVSWQQEPAAR
jgi:hypothetical protein